MSTPKVLSESESDGAATSLFPLRFTPFEFYFLTEESAQFAGLIPIELEARGRLDRPAFERAYELTHHRHPLMSAHVEFDQHGWPQWVAGEPNPIRYGETSPPCEERPEKIPNVEVEVWEEPDRVRFHFAFRHVAVDGLGCFQFIEDLFLIYSRLAAGPDAAPDCRPLEPERLRDRDGHQLFNRKLKLSDFWRIAKVHVPLSLRQAALVSNEQHAGVLEPAGGGSQTSFLVEHLTKEESEALPLIAGKKSCMLNDLLVRDYFLMLAKWNAGTSQARRPLRIMIPTNMRRREDLRMPSANVFSYAFLTRTARDCRDPDRLLTSIRDEMADIKREKRGLYYEAALRWFCLWPAFLRWSLKRDWTFATAVFTNLGTGFDHVRVPSHGGRKVAGNLVFDIGAGAGPIRPGTRISFAAHSYAGRLAIGARCDPHSLTVGQEQALLDAYVAQLRETIAREGPN